MPSFWAASSGLSPGEIISADELRQKQLNKEKFLLLDARSKEHYDLSHIEGAELPRTAEFYRQEELFRKQLVRDWPDAESALAQNLQEVPRDLPIVTYCSVDCSASAVLLIKLKSLGFKNVKVMEEGIQAWEKKGYPVTLAAPRLSL